MFKTEFQFRVSNALAISFGHTWGGLATWSEVDGLSADAAQDLLISRATCGPAGWGITYPDVDATGRIVHTSATRRYRWSVGEPDVVVEIHTRPLVEGGSSRPMAAVLVCDCTDGSYMIGDILWADDAKDHHVMALQGVLDEVFGSPEAFDAWDARVLAARAAFAEASK